MLIDNPIALVAGCAGGAAALNLAVLKISPEIRDRTRHLVTGAGPVVAALGAMIGTQDSVTAYGSDLMALGASLVGGLAAAIGSTMFVRPEQMLPKT